MTITLRTARDADKDAVIDLIQVLNRHEADLIHDRKRDRAAAAAYYGELQLRLAQRSGRIVLAEEDGRIVGAMGYCIDEDAAYVIDGVRRHGVVTDLVVHDEWRGRGVGRLLLAEAERLTREAGHTRLMIGVVVGNDGAERLYRGVGFRPYVSILVKDV